MSKPTDTVTKHYHYLVEDKNEKEGIMNRYWNELSTYIGVPDDIIVEDNFKGKTNEVDIVSYMSCGNRLRYVPPFRNKYGWVSSGISTYLNDSLDESTKAELLEELRVLREKYF
jgi:hypothetical protein